MQRDRFKARISKHGIQVLHKQCEQAKSSDQLLQGARRITDKIKNYHFFSMPKQALVGQGLLIIESSLLHSDTPQ